MILRCVTIFGSGTKNGLVMAVFGNGIGYYFYILAISAINILLITRLPTGPNLLLMTIVRATHAALACRVVLDIREQKEILGKGRLEEHQLDWMSDWSVHEDVEVSSDFDSYLHPSEKIIEFAV
ncbi:hypothetical protein NP233_g1533 [Leucocoprinus birnbaumii]|uniref:Uncharacterized protein n=1 Tax=Leucocoprinus birnbaumii TaxID=56174 RepID=A0AAD5W2E2_9AGAR|nr:hypothetical protein NP233_g1533 [Leucocoprinus birnbaumii]